MITLYKRDLSWEKYGRIMGKTHEKIIWTSENIYDYKSLEIKYLQEFYNKKSQSIIMFSIDIFLKSYIFVNSRQTFF